MKFNLKTIVIGTALLSPLFVYVGVAVVTRVIIFEIHIPRIQEMSLNVMAHHEEMLRDLALLDANPIFNKSTRLKDATSFLMKHVEWSNEERDDKLEKWTTIDQIAALKKDHEAFGREPVEFEKLVADPKTNEIDVTWVDELKDFDHFNPSAYPDVAKKFEMIPKMGGLTRMGMIASMEFPDYQQIHMASVIRLLQLHKQNRSLEGLQLLRKSSELMHTTPNLIGAMMAAMSLKREGYFVEQLKIKGWRLIDADRIQAYKAISWAWAGVLHEGMWEVFPTEFEKYMKPENGFCAGVGEKALGMALYDFLEPTAFLEVDFTRQVNQSRELLKKSFAICSMKEYEPLLTPLPFEENPIFSNTLSPFALSNEPNALSLHPVRLPFARRFIGATLLTVSFPSYMKMYNERTPAGAPPGP